MIEDLHKACGALPLKPNRRCSPWRRPQRLVIASANSTFWLSALESSLYQSGLRGDCRGACLLALSGWLSEYMEGLGSGAPARCLPSPPVVPALTSASWPLCVYLAAQEVSFSYLQCSQCRDLCQLTRFEWYPKTSATAVGQLSHRWGLDVGRTASAATSSPERSFPRCSIRILEPTRTVIGVGSLYSRLGGSPLPQHSARGIETRYQQLH